jgi:hypothetical protein
MRPGSKQWKSFLKKLHGLLIVTVLALDEIMGLAQYCVNDKLHTVVGIYLTVK